MLKTALSICNILRHRTSCSRNHLVGAGEKRGRYREAEYLLSCSPPLQETFTSGLSTVWSPSPLPGITTVATGQFPPAGLTPAGPTTSVAAQLPPLHAMTKSVAPLARKARATALSPTGWPQRSEGEHRYRTDGRPIVQWSRLKAGHSDDLGTADADFVPAPQRLAG